MCRWTRPIRQTAGLHAGRCRPQVLLTQERLKDLLPQTEAHTIALDSDWRRIDEQPDTNLALPSLGLKPQHLAYMIYTSGSTGQPKGAMNEHRGVVNRLHWMQKAYGLTADDARPAENAVQLRRLGLGILLAADDRRPLVMAKPEGHKDPGYLSEVIAAAAHHHAALRAVDAASLSGIRQSRGLHAVCGG